MQDVCIMLREESVKYACGVLVTHMRREEEMYVSVIFRQERMRWTTTLISTPTLIVFWTLYSSMVGIAKSSFLHSMLMPASCEGCLMLMMFCIVWSIFIETDSGVAEASMPAWIICMVHT